MLDQFKILVAAFSLGVVAAFTYLFYGYTNSVESPSVYKGFISYGFEGRHFNPCKYPEEVWWVSSEGGDIGFELHHATTGDHYKPAYIEALMEVSSKGEHGHMGVSDREATLLSIKYLSNELPVECG